MIIMRFMAVGGKTLIDEFIHSSITESMTGESELCRLFLHSFLLFLVENFISVTSTMLISVPYILSNPVLIK